jgi:hypothetical protein
VKEYSVMILRFGKSGGRKAREFVGSKSSPIALRLTAILATALALAACSAGTPDGSRTSAPNTSKAARYLGLNGEPPIGQLQVVKDPNSLKLPLDSYYLTPSEMLTIFEAQRAAEQACIHKYLPGLQLGAFGRVVFLPPTTDPLPYLAPGQAAKYGYHDPQLMALTAQDQVPLHGAALTDAVEVDTGTVDKFDGLPVLKGGCDVVGVAAVTHGITPSLIPTGYANLATVGGIANLIDHSMVLGDSRVKTADTQWSACMASQGYFYARPQLAMNNPIWNARNPANGFYRRPITAAEIKTAEADVACRAKANLYAVYWAVAAAYQREWLASPQNVAMAQAEEQADQVMLTRAEGILGG